jgi:hypothetical protein
MLMKRGVYNYGYNAGKIWKILSNGGPQSANNIMKKTKINDKEFYAAVGWLARENKIQKNGSYYTLGETNLTNVIGENAGKIWWEIEKHGEIDVSTISKNTNIKPRDAYSALGWLAREDKIEITSIRQTKNAKAWFSLK